MRPFICISYVSADEQAAQKLLGELTRYGFRYEALDEKVPRRERETYLTEAEANVVLTSPAAADSSLCAADIRFLLGRERQVLCVSLGENGLDSRFCPDGEGNAEMIAYPVGETPDRSRVAYYIHRLYLCRLCRCAEAFSAVRCVDDAYGRLIRLAIQAYRVCAGEKFDRKDEYAAAVQAVSEMADAYTTGVTAPRIESEAAAWLERGAALNHPDSLLRLAEWRLVGGAVRRDPAGALELFRRLADEGDMRGLFRVGECALNGIGMMRDPAAAADAFARAAAAGYLPARYRLGLLHRERAETSADWYRAAFDLYAACGELTGYRPPDRNIGAVPEDMRSVVRPVEPRPAWKSDRTTRTVPVRRAISMRRMREKRLVLLLSGKAPERGGSDRPARSLHSQDCMARSRGKRLGTADSRRLGSALFGRDIPDAERSRGRNEWDPADAAYELGRMLETGCARFSCPPLPLHALYWYRLAAERGHGSAILRLAECYRLGTGVLRDIGEAVRLYRLAANQGNPEAQFRLGVCCEQGLSVRQDAAEAVRWYGEAAQNGYAPAQNNLGGCYEHGVGVRQDLTRAVDCYRRAAQAGVPEAACRLGLCYEHGLGVRPNPGQAFSLYERAADAGHPYAMYRLGLCYDWGRAVPPHLSRAAQLYGDAARAGNPEAAYAVGLCCRDGRGIRKDSAQAYDWFTASAEGCAQGALEAGLCLLEGRGVIRKPEEAAMYFAIAARAVPGPLTEDRTAVGAPLPEGASNTPDVTRTPYDGEPDAAPVRSDAGDPSANNGADADHDLPPTARSTTDAAAEATYRLAYCAAKNGIPSVSHLTRAARLGSNKACLALGDLYTTGRLARSGWSAEDAAVLWYRQALRCPPSPAGENEGAATARLRLAVDCLRRAENATQPETDRWNALGWSYLEGAAEGGCPEALIRMAECAFRGIGTSRDARRAWSLLEGVRRRFGTRCGTVVSLWQGSLCLAGAADRPGEAAESPDTIAVRDAERRRRAADLYRQAIRSLDHTDDRARAEAMYRLAVLESDAAELSGTAPGDGAFAWLCKAILAGHSAARQDFAHILQTRMSAEPDTDAGSSKSALTLAQTLRDRIGISDPQDPNVWMRRYYAAHPVEQKPFSYIEANPDGDTPAPVAQRLDAEVMYYLGECLFRGLHVPTDRVAALACFRQAAAYKPGRGEEICHGALWAQYSLGWCLVRGVGCSPDPREGVVWLGRAARYHGQAALMLAECYERGIGVDAPDSRGAVTYYRRALKLGCTQAAAGVAAMEKALRNHE